MNIVDSIRSREDVNALKRVLNEGKMRNLLLFLLGINTGLRISDLLALKISDIKGRDCVQIIEKKTNKTKQFPISKEIQPFIKEACLELGIYNAGTLSLRKTFGYHFYKQTKDIAILQKILNHSSQEITLRYIGLTQEIIEDNLRMFAL